MDQADYTYSPFTSFLKINIVRFKDITNVQEEYKVSVFRPFESVWPTIHSLLVVCARILQMRTFLLETRMGSSALG